MRRNGAIGLIPLCLRNETNGGKMWGEGLMNSWDPDVYSKAWHFATLAHQGQLYGGPTEGISIDYINHIGNVAMEVLWALSAAPDFDANPGGSGRAVT